MVALCGGALYRVRQKEKKSCYYFWQKTEDKLALEVVFTCYILIFLHYDASGKHMFSIFPPRPRKG